MTFLSIIIPAYNEEARLPGSLRKIIEFVERSDFSSEVIVVDDGSADRTAEIVSEYQKDRPYIRLIQVEHGGKGHAVRAGMLAAVGEYLFLADSDLSMPIEEVLKFLPPALDGYDIAIASREIAGSRRYGEPHFRHIIGRIFNLLVRLLAVPGLGDTQAGFKCFGRQAARTLFPMQTIAGWGFDVEILMIAQKKKMKIVEVPINWYYNPDSRVRPIYDAYRMFAEVIKIRWNERSGLYDRADDALVPVTAQEPKVNTISSNK
jgi:dolichyl-phosphate beta-glucosyltransferase